MEKVKSIVTMVVMVFMLLGVARADWIEGDPYKMHWPQLPDPVGWDVHASEPFIVADDFQCAETGWIQDIHFWGSWMGGYIPPLTTLYGFWISIHEDIPASQNPNGSYSQPGTVLLNNFYPIEDFIVDGPFFGEQGWYDPVQGLVLPFDHFEHFQYNLFLPEQDWVHQTEGNIYWLNISAVVADPFFFPWGWKTTFYDLRFLDTSVWIDQFGYPDLWFPIYDPFIGPLEHLDMAFVITGEPDCPPIDSDNDGIDDCNDNCIATPNPGQEDTYPPPSGNKCGDVCECEGNFDDDQDQDGSDAAKFKADFGRSPFFRPCTNVDPCNGDFDCDGDVDGTNAALFKSDFGRSPFSNPCPFCPTDPWCVYP